jgi:methylated-DNA-[protein]-cysteine S-methyltransferase
MQIETPFGPAWAAIDAAGALTRFSFGRPEPDGGYSPDLAKQLEEFFKGARQEFDLAMAPEGTDFQKRVWAELVKIPFGETISYGKLARRIGDPAASRAVGHANHMNPIALIVPCHRVIGADGTLTGYAGGLELKDKLLRWERSFREPGLFSSSIFPDCI